MKHVGGGIAIGQNAASLQTKLKQAMAKVTACQGAANTGEKKSAAANCADWLGPEERMLLDASALI